MSTRSPIGWQCQTVSGGLEAMWYLMRPLTRGAPSKKLRRTFMTANDLPSISVNHTLASKTFAEFARSRLVPGVPLLLLPTTIYLSWSLSLSLVFGIVSSNKTKNLSVYFHEKTKEPDLKDILIFNFAFVRLIIAYRHKWDDDNERPRSWKRFRFVLRLVNQLPREFSRYLSGEEKKCIPL